MPCKNIFYKANEYFYSVMGFFSPGKAHYDTKKAAQQWTKFLKLVVKTYFSITETYFLRREKKKEGEE